MDTFVPPCPLISMISSTGVLQLASFVDSEKTYTPVSVLCVPVLVDIPPAVPASTVAVSSSSGSSAGQPPVSSKAPSSFSFGAPVVPVAVSSSGGGSAGQPPIASKAPSTFGGFGAPAVSVAVPVAVAV